MTIVTRVGFILDMGRVDRDAAGLFFGRLVNFGVICELGPALVGENLGDGGGQGRFSMVDVTYGPDVHMWLCTRELGGSCVSIASHRGCQRLE